ncbi:MAG: trypsin-like peptidase domain-containing protein [Acidobacteriota bacterium]|nr:trypsin-like peptidase domain-containing protein [Acidobacteriota bacterium]MDQ3168953.1 trypsin-like peptidase domain-containing protein [Acidobacteriota bacterium]
MNKKTSVFSAILIAIMSLAVGMVLASRLDLTPSSGAQPMSVPAANADPITGPLDATTFRRIAQNVSPAVVSIQTQSRRPRRDTQDSGNNPFFGQPRQPRGGQPERPLQGSGTGFIIDKANGYIITNNHVIEGADEIKVGFYGDDDRADTFSAKIVGRDPLTDSALIQLTERPNHELSQISFGDSDQMAPGDWVVAIGNPFGLRHTVTVGVVSAVGRDNFQTVNGRSQVMIQTDAAINPGNSGGPLLNVRGEVVGVNTAIFTNQTSSNLGIGFAVPINFVRTLLPQLQTGRIIRGKIGVSVNNNPITADEARDYGLPGAGGALISTVDEDGAAANAGLRAGDFVVEFNGKPIKNSSELVGLVVNTRPGTTVPMKIVRDRQQRTVNVTIDELDLLTAEGETTAARQSTDGAFGLTLQPLTPQIARQLQLPAGTQGALIAEVAPASIAERAGLGEGDVITNIGGRAVRNTEEASRALDAVPQGGSTLVRFIRGGQESAIGLRKR